MVNRVYYLKGLAEGLRLNDKTKEGKILLEILDVLEDMALEFENLDEYVSDEVEQIYDEIDELSEYICDDCLDYDEEDDYDLFDEDDQDLDDDLETVQDNQ